MPKAVIIWETRNGATSSIAMEVKDVLVQEGIDVTAKKIFNAEDEGFDLLTAMNEADAVILGSPTYNHDLMHQVKEFLVKMEKCRLEDKIGGAFGSCGWSGEAVYILTHAMKNKFKMNVIEPGLKIIDRPNGKSLDDCKQFGKAIAAKLKA
jgi:flavorubredoxin